MNSSVNAKDSLNNSAVLGPPRPLLSNGREAGGSARRGPPEDVDTHATRPRTRFTRTERIDQQDPKAAAPSAAEAPYDLQFPRPGLAPRRKEHQGSSAASDSSVAARPRAGTAARPKSTNLVAVGTYPAHVLAWSDPRPANLMQHSKLTRAAQALPEPPEMIPQRPYSEESPCKKPDAPHTSKEQRAHGVSSHPFAVDDFRAPDEACGSSSHPGPYFTTSIPKAGNRLAVTQNISHEHPNASSMEDLTGGLEERPLSAKQSFSTNTADVPKEVEACGNFTRRVDSKSLRNTKAAITPHFNAVNTAALILHHLLIRKSAGGVLEHTPRADAVAAITDFLARNGAHTVATHTVGAPRAPKLDEAEAKQQLAAMPRCVSHPVPPALLSKSAAASGVSAEKAMVLLLTQLPDIFNHGLLEQLRLTLDQFVTRITPSSSERDAKRRLFNAFADFLRRAMQDRIAISVAGSTAYEVDAKGSDLDVVLLTNWGAPLYVLQSIVQYLQMTQALTQNTSMAASNWPLRNVQLQLVDSARVPVLTLTTPSGLVCDVSVNTLNSVKHTEFFKKVIGINGHLRSMMRLLKYWAKVRKLPTMREGGLPGIVWMLLAVYFGSCSAEIFLGALAESGKEGDPAAPVLRKPEPPFEGGDPPSTDGSTDSELNGPQGGRGEQGAGRKSTERDTEVIFSLHSSLHKTAPLFAALFQFFKLCDSRLTMARTISCTGRYCAKKNPEEIAERVGSAQNFFGVWDEVVSVEDPAVTAEPVFPSAANWIDAPLATQKSNATPKGHTADPVPPPAAPNKNPGGFEPGISTDLAAKISSATWIVYMVELKRGSSILMKLLHFINDAYKKVGNLAEAIRVATKSALGATLPKNKRTGLPPNPVCEALSTGTNGYEQSARDYMARQFRQYIAFLFNESVSDRFLLPGCDEKLRQLIDFGCTTNPTTTSKNSNTTINGKTKTTTSSESSSHSTTASSTTASSTATDRQEKFDWTSLGLVTHEATRPFCTCCSVPRNEFAIVLLHGRLHILRMTSICTDWTSWWTKDFLSRRDVRSVVHGTLHQITRPQEYLRFVPQYDKSKYVLTELPPTGWFPNIPPSQKNDFNFVSSNDDGGAEKVPYPCLLLPVRKFADSTPVEILFHPCDFVCRLKGWRIPTYSDQDGVLVDDVFYLESDEANYLAEMTKVAAEASWYSKGNPTGFQQSGLVNGRKQEKSSFQPAAADCAGCGMDGDLMDNLETVAGYRCPDGAFQFAWVTQSSNHKNNSIPLGTAEMIRAAWRRWVAHAAATASKHVCEENSAPDFACSIPPGQLVITPELARATQLLAVTIEGLWKRPGLNYPAGRLPYQVQRRSARVLLHPVRVAAANSRRCRSLPDRLGEIGKESHCRSSKHAVPASCVKVVLEKTVYQRHDSIRNPSPSKRARTPSDEEVDNDSDEVARPNCCSKDAEVRRKRVSEIEAGGSLNGSSQLTICRQKEIVELRSFQRKLWSADSTVTESADQCVGESNIQGFPESTPTGQAELLNGGEKMMTGSSSVDNKKSRRQQAAANSQRGQNNNTEGSRRLLQSALKGTLKTESPASGGQRKNRATRSETAVSSSSSSSSNVLGGGMSNLEADSACSSFRNCSVEERQAVCLGVPPPPPSFPPRSPL